MRPASLAVVAQKQTDRASHNCQWLRRFACHAALQCHGSYMPMNKWLL